jgi:hypothetical protein
MDNKTRHLYADYICVVIMLIGFILFSLVFLNVELGAIIGTPIIIFGLVGMYLNEKINPYDGKTKNNRNNI